MPQHIGIDTCSAEGADLDYRAISWMVPICWRPHNHAEISMHAHPFAERRARSRSVMKEDKKMPVVRDEGENPQLPGRRQLKFRWLPGAYAIVRMDPEATVPDWATKGVFSSVTRTADELSIVCPADKLPVNLSSECHWICFKLEGPFPFSQTAVLLSFIEPLSNKGVPIFAISTYDTDYVLVQEEFMGVAQQALRTAGHALISDEDESWRKLIE